MCVCMILNPYTNDIINNMIKFFNFLSLITKKLEHNRKNKQQTPQ